MGFLIAVRDVFEIEGGWGVKLPRLKLGYVEIVVTRGWERGERGVSTREMMRQGVQENSPHVEKACHRWVELNQSG